MFFICLQSVSIYAAYLYDAFMLYATALHSLVGKLNPITMEGITNITKNGTAIIEEIIARRNYTSM